MSRTAVLLRTLAVPAAVIMLAAGSAGSAAAQNSATIAATANVLTPLVVNGTDLRFGDVYPGVPKTINVGDADAASFSVTGYGGANVNLTFELPATLSGPSSSSLAIDSWTGYRNATNSASSGGSAFVPSTTSNESAALSAAGELFVFVGATVRPVDGQTAGSYTGDVKMTVSYTGT